MWSPRANFPCPMGIGHQAWARVSRLIDPAPCLLGAALVEDLHDLGAQAAGELPVPAERVLPGDPALLVRAPLRGFQTGSYRCG